MPRKAKPGDRIGNYEIVKELNVGGMAFSYSARSSEGCKVFFKQYKSPTPTVSWYHAYVEYQSELKRRIEGGVAKNFSYKFIEFFEQQFGSRTYFQVFEFVEGGHDLEVLLASARRRRDGLSWETRLILAKVMMAGVNALHEAKVVHCDLKPANIQLFPDESIDAKFRLKLIDMDFSVLSDRTAPWHDEAGYVGSPNYFSPEHLRGEAPQSASDVFTCGLILYELLSGAHPYCTDEPETYAASALNHRAAPPTLLGTLPPPAADETVQQTLHRCLSPGPADRPTARDVNLALNGRLSAPLAGPRGSSSPGPSARPSSPAPSSPTPRPAASASSVPASPEKTAPAPVPSRPPAAVKATKLVLASATGAMIQFAVRTPVGKHLCRGLGEESQFVDSVQFVVERNGAGQWLVHPNLEAKNETILNGKAVTTPTAIKNGDLLGVGRAAKGIVKLPMLVRIE
ncbi:MAG TPA: protein kinase [Pirellulales bacterium]|jgi:serine/threonine protein kinase|nr:protein kinase [Pirellulales bacterium]